MKRSPIKPTSDKRAAEIKAGAKMSGTFKVDLTALQARGGTMSPKTKDTLFGKAKGFKKRHKVTGEVNTLDRLIRERGAVSEISGEPLVEKGHERYHWQLFHVLGKGEYPELRLFDGNLLLSTWQEQDQWTRRKWELKDKPTWAHVFAMEETLKYDARQRLNAELSGRTK
jgi:hypothetical protein